jgi:hypothetical protein
VENHHHAVDTLLENVGEVSVPLQRDVDQRPFGVSLDGQRRELRSNVFSRLVNLVRFVVDESSDFERIIVELKVARGTEQ